MKHVVSSDFLWGFFQIKQYESSIQQGNGLIHRIAGHYQCTLKLHLCKMKKDNAKHWQVMRAMLHGRIIAALASRNDTRAGKPFGKQAPDLRAGGIVDR